MKPKLFTLLLLILVSSRYWAQTTETFESHTTGKPTSFTSGGQSFTLSQNDCANGGTFGVFIPGQTWTPCSGGSVSNISGNYGVGTSCTAGVCTGTSAKFIDNGSSNGTGQIYYIKTTDAALFTIKALHVYVSNDKGNTPASSGVTFKGKRGGTVIYTITKSSGLNTSFGTNNGFTYIDFSTEGGVNNSNYNIDELEIQGGASNNYLAIDNFIWSPKFGPVVTTSAATSVGATSATLNGIVNDNAYTTTVSFDYGTSPSLAGATNTGATTGGTVNANAGNTNSALTITGLAASTTYYFRVKAVNSVSTLTGSILNFTTSSAPTPSITTTGSLSAFTSCAGSPSASQSFTVSGSNLTANLIVSAPTGFEVSTSSGSGYANMVTLVPASGTVNNTSVYARLTSAATGTPSGNITCASTGAISKTVASSGTVITLTASLSSKTDITCNGGANGSVTVSPSGGTGPYLFSWAPSGGTSATASNLAAGTYTCTITESHLCSATQTVTLTQPNAIVNNQSKTICKGDSIIVGTHTYKIAGDYTDHLLTMKNCDSTVNTHLIVNPTYSINKTAHICKGDSILLGGNYQKIAGVYKDVYKTILSCDSIIHTTLIVDSVYHINTTLKICKGDSVMLAGHYQTNPGIYTDPYKTISGCDSIIHTTLIVNPLPVVTLDLSAMDTLCSNGSPVTLTGGNPSGGTYTGNGVNAAVFSPAVAGTGTTVITYSYIDLNGCKNKVEANIFVDVCTGINMLIPVDYALNIYPNPYSQSFTIETTINKNQTVLISVYNMIGERVLQYEQPVNTGLFKKEIQTEELSSGVYFISIQTTEQTRIRRIIKE